MASQKEQEGDSKELRMRQGLSVIAVCQWQEASLGLFFILFIFLTMHCCPGFNILQVGGSLFPTSLTKSSKMMFLHDSLV